MKRSIRSLVPESPWCAAAAAWCALAILVADAAMLALRIGATAWRKIEVWRLLHGLDPLVSLESAHDAAPPYVTVTVSFSLVPTAALLALAMLGVAHALRVLAPLRVPESGPPRSRGGAVALAAALGGVLVLYTVPTVVVHVLDAAAGFPSAGGGVSVSGFVRAQLLLFSVESIAVALGFAALPFCLLRLSGRRFAAPPSGSPGEADARRAEAWLSIALAAGAAALAGDAAWMLLGRLAHPFHGISFGMNLLSFVAALAQPLLALCALAAVRDALRRLLAEDALPDEPGGRNGALAAVVATAAAGLVFVVALAAQADWSRAGGRLLSILAEQLLLLAPLVLCAALVRRLPVPPGAQPAPPRPVSDGPARARIGLALGLAALACAAFEAWAAAAAALAAAGALCLGQRRAHPRVAWAGLAAAALAAFLLCKNDLLRGSWLFHERGPAWDPPAEYAEPEPHAEGAELESHAESAENAEPEPHAESAEGAE